MVRTLCGSLLLMITPTMATPLVAQEAQADPAFDRDVYVASFDQVWQTIAKTHWDPAVVGDSWDRTRDRLRPRIISAKSADQAREILDELLAELGQSHFGIIPAETYAKIEQEANRGGPGFSGVNIRWVEENFVVTSVAEQSPAALAGIRPGWVLLSATDNAGKRVTSEELIARLRSAEPHSLMRLETSLSLAGNALTTGSIGDKLRLEFATPDRETCAKTLVLVKGPGKPAKLGNLPTTHVVFAAKQLDGQIGYIKFNAFLDAPRLIREFQQVIKDPASSQGLIIDLRGNMGGLLLLTMGMGGWFVESPVSLGTVKMKNAPLELRLNPRKPRYAAPVAVLIDECSISAAEVMAGGLQDLGVAKVFGSRSAGLVLPSTVVRLPSGDGFQYALAGYESGLGVALEENGVSPDHPVPLSRDSLVSGADPTLAAALDWLRLTAYKPLTPTAE